MFHTVRGCFRGPLYLRQAPARPPARQPFVFLFRPAESTARRRRLDWRSHLALASGALELPPRARKLAAVARG